MSEKKEQNNPKRIFREQDDLVVPSKPLPEQIEKLTSVRQSDLTSIAPDDINWNNIYCGKQHGLFSAKREMESRKKDII